MASRSPDVRAPRYYTESTIPYFGETNETGGTDGTNYFTMMHLTQILTPRRQGAKESIGFELPVLNYRFSTTGFLNYSPLPLRERGRG